jgi:hypothetical protein
MNTVLNFSYHGVKTVAAGLRSAVVPSDMPATMAATLAEMNSFDVLFVQDASGETKGTFFPDFLREHLLVNPATAHLLVAQPLPDMIQTVGFHLPDFHSELVNIQPDLRVCRIGPHVSASNPCKTHHIPTDPYIQ